MMISWAKSVTVNTQNIEYLELCWNISNGQEQLWPRIPRLRVSNTRLAQAASGCAPSVDVLPISDVKQATIRNLARRVLGGWCQQPSRGSYNNNSVWGIRSRAAINPTDDESRQ
ncbi:hypothetical protein WN51_05514 [Melipona quadrifasciata]|uniref:Uncharacterized protein n=1 Tax=Melipona quadrifasciata TaxID=166423 RepID=A0A0M8ZUG5_9HYME|nr:hypothetical protein WN51_05514 [Melipona quadrifasciata]